DRELVFVVDVSGSMHGVPLNMSRDAMREALRSMRPGDTFNVLTFAGRTAKLFEEPQQASQANIIRAQKFITGLRAGGGTHLGSAVEAALEPRDNDGRSRFVFFLTDGYVGREKQIFSMTERFVETLTERGQKARVFAMGVGSSVNRHLLDGISRAGSGTTVYATTRQDPAVAVRNYYRLIDHPILENVEVDFGDGKVQQVYPEVMPDLLASRPTVLFGRYAGSGSTTVTVRGEHDGQPVEYSYHVDLPKEANAHESLPIMWARARIDGLQRDLWHGPSAEAKASITKLGLRYGLVTPYTSFVAVDSERTVGDGNPAFIDQAVHVPEGVNPHMAGARMLKSRRAMSQGRIGGVIGPAASFSGRTRSTADHLVISSKGPVQPPVTGTPDRAEEENRGAHSLASGLTQARMARLKQVLIKSKSSLPIDFLSLLRERPKYFAGAKARLRIGSDGQVLEVRLVSNGPLHDRRYRAVRRFYMGLKFSPRPQNGDIWVEFKLDAPYLK
ncbi:MAG: VWA domain-containing protein, partial [Myxococcota bacterium]|nr:VWA domain-containing protein [Myxococcota bacterium]